MQWDMFQEKLHRDIYTVNTLRISSYNISLDINLDLYIINKKKCQFFKGLEQMTVSCCLMLVNLHTIEGSV